MNPKTTIKRLGGVNSAAAKLDYTPRAIRYWLTEGRIPRHAQKLIKSIISQEQAK